MLGQAQQAHTGVTGPAGNHVVIAIDPNEPFMVLAHLRQHTVQVHPGQYVQVGAVPIDRSFVLNEAAEAFRYQESDRHFGKICLEF